jgi:hypothetical protein
MSARLPKYVPLFLVSALAVTACHADTVTSPSDPAPVSQKVAFTAEPDTIVPEFVPTRSCSRFSPFDARFVIVVRSHDDVFLRGMRLRFLDRLGNQSFPQHVVPFPGTSSTLQFNAGPITIPTSSAIPTPVNTIPIPGASGLDPLLVEQGFSRTLPFVLRFGCGIRADGTVFVDFDLSDRRGRSGRSEVRVRLRG